MWASADVPVALKMDLAHLKEKIHFFLFFLQILSRSISDHHLRCGVGGYGRTKCRSTIEYISEYSFLQVDSSDTRNPIFDKKWTKT